MKNNIATLFFRGDYRRVIDLTLRPGGNFLASERDTYCWLIGALCFSGRKEEAEAIFLQLESKADTLPKAACRFFLGVAFCRHGHYAKARHFFARNLWTHRNDAGDLGFFAWQGFAFYLYFRAEFEKSNRAAFNALARASLSRFTYGRALASDIIGHSWVQQGQVSGGLGRLLDAKKEADKLGNGGLSNSIEISSLVYRAQFGLEPRTIIRDLLKAQNNSDPQNSYAKANLLLELANQYILRGKIECATQVLNDASTLIYASQHRRYAHLLALRFAEVAYRKGEFASALHAVQMQRVQLDPKYDRINLLMALGLEIKLLRALKMESQLTPLLSLLSDLTDRTTRSLAKNIFLRGSDRDAVPTGEDRIASLIYSASDSASFRCILRSPYKGFIYESLKLSPGTSWIAVGADELIVMEKGEVTYRKASMPAQLLRLLAAFALGYKSKEELIEKIWGYSYHPLHHDPLLYQGVARLREAFGTKGYVIESTAEGYRLKKGFGFIPLGEEGPQTNPLFDNRNYLIRSKRDALKRPDFPLSLNERQLRILELIRNQQCLGVRECLRRFKVSDMTLKRDFAGLVRGGWVLRVGQARATRYTLKDAQGLSNVEGLREVK